MVVNVWVLVIKYLGIVTIMMNTMIIFSGTTVLIEKNNSNMVEIEIKTCVGSNHFIVK